MIAAVQTYSKFIRKATKAPSPPSNETPAPSAFPTDVITGANDASCAVVPACSELAGDCCPNEFGVRLDCCDQLPTPPSKGQFFAFISTNRALVLDAACSAHPECSHLAGPDCCPTIDNVVLDCCSFAGPFQNHLVCLLSWHASNHVSLFAF